MDGSFVLLLDSQAAAKCAAKQSKRLGTAAGRRLGNALPAAMSR